MKKHKMPMQKKDYRLQCDWCKSKFHIGDVNTGFIKDLNHVFLLCSYCNLKANGTTYGVLR